VQAIVEKKNTGVAETSNSQGSRKRTRGKILLLLVEGQPDVKIKAIKGGV